MEAYTSFAQVYWEKVAEEEVQIISLISRLRKPFAVNLLPGRYVEDIKKAGADLICVHQEACLHLDRTIAQIREAGLQTGVALNPATPVETLDVILPEVDMVLLMTVNPGFGGQKFIPYTVEKIKKLRAMCSRSR